MQDGWEHARHFQYSVNRMYVVVEAKYLGRIAWTLVGGTLGVSRVEVG